MAYPLACGHVVSSLENEPRIPTKSCPECGGKEVYEALLYMPECGHIVDIEQADHHNLLQDLYEVDARGMIAGFKTMQLDGLRKAECPCGTPCPLDRYQDLDKFASLPDTLRKVFLKINQKIRGFSGEINAVQRGLDGNFEVFQSTVRPGVFAWDANQGLVMRRLTDVKEVSERLSAFSGEVVKPFEDHLLRISQRTGGVPDYLFPFSLRFQVLAYRTISVRLADMLRMAKHMCTAMVDPSYQVQRFGEQICQHVQAEALKYVTHDLPQTFEKERSRIDSSPSLDAEFRLRESRLMAGCV